MSDWLAWAEPLAYGLLALKPWELEQLQPYEFLLMVEGAVWRKERQEDVLAYFTAIITSPHLKKPISGRVLTDHLRGKSEEKAHEEKQQYFKDTFGLD